MTNNTGTPKPETKKLRVFEIKIENSERPGLVHLETFSAKDNI